MEISDLKAQLKDVETCVRYLLAHFPETRNSDRLLFLLYWQIIDKIAIPQEFRGAFLQHATPPETIRRVRQRIQQSGDYLPRKEILEARKSRSRTFREALKEGQVTL